MEELGIVIHYGQNQQAEPALGSNLASFRRCNPGVPIVEVLNKLPSERAWHDLDLPIYEWYQTRTIQCKRWFLIDWDCWCSVSIREFVGDAWDSPVTASCVCYPNRETHWPWFPQIPLLSEKYTSFARGIYPMNAVLVADEALAAISKEAPKIENVFCELRFATAASYLGFCPRPYGRNDCTNSWIPFKDEQITYPSIWHPVKFAMPVDKFLPR